MRARATAKRLATAISIGSLFALPACFGTETGNPPFAPDLGAGGFDPMGISPDPTIDGARIAVEEAALEDCDGGRRPLFRNGVLDAVAGTLTVGERLEIVPGAFCAIELRIAACADPDRCRTVAPDAVSIDGMRRSDTATIAVRATGPITVRLEGVFEVSPGAGGLLIAVDRTLLTAGLSLTTLPALDGVVRIDASTNADRLPALASAVQGAITLRRDLDDDGVLDREELMGTPLAEPPGL